MYTASYKFNDDAYNTENEYDDDDANCTIQSAHFMHTFLPMVGESILSIYQTKTKFI